MRYSKAIQLVHEASGAMLCIDVHERAESEGFAMKVVLKTLEPPSGELADGTGRRNSHGVLPALPDVVDDSVGVSSLEGQVL